MRKLLRRSAAAFAAAASLVLMSLNAAAPAQADCPPSRPG